jgi:hypothetical protein
MVVVGAFAVTEVIGLFASKVFERLLRVDPVFAAGAPDYFRVGTLALFPFVIVWTSFGAVVSLLVGLGALIWPHTGLVRRRLSRLSELLDPATLAGLVVCLGVAGLALLTWSFYGVYYAMTALGLDQRPDLLDLSILGPAGRPVHRTHASPRAQGRGLVGARMHATLGGARTLSALADCGRPSSALHWGSRPGYGSLGWRNAPPSLCAYEP